MGVERSAAIVRDSELEHPEHLTDERLAEIVAASLIQWQAYPTIPGSLRWSRNGLTALHEMEARRNRV